MPDALGEVAALEVPAGSYVVLARADLDYVLSGSATITCRLVVGAAAEQFVRQTSAGLTRASLEAAGTLQEPGRIQLLCADGDQGIVARSLRVTAINVDSIESSTLPSPALLPDLVAMPEGTSTIVTNTGNAASAPSKVRIEWQAHSAHGVYDVPGLLPGRSYSIDHNCRTGPTEVIADFSDVIVESDETNNAVTASPTCPP